MAAFNSRFFLFFKQKCLYLSKNVILSQKIRLCLYFLKNFKWVEPIVLWYIGYYVYICTFVILAHIQYVFLICNSLYMYYCTFYDNTHVLLW